MNNLPQMLLSLKNNPSALLGRFGIPVNLMNDPNAMIQFLMNNGKVTQEQYNNAVKKAQSMGFKI